MADDGLDVQQRSEFRSQYADSRWRCQNLKTWTLAGTFYGQPVNRFDPVLPVLRGLGPELPPDGQDEAFHLFQGMTNRGGRKRIPAFQRPFRL